jgi:hypothetical protein
MTVFAGKFTPLVLSFVTPNRLKPEDTEKWKRSDTFSRDLGSAPEWVQDF